MRRKIVKLLDELRSYENINKKITDEFVLLKLGQQHC